MSLPDDKTRAAERSRGETWWKTTSRCRITASGFSGMLFTRLCIPAVPDVLHARICVILLLAVLMAMAI